MEGWSTFRCLKWYTFQFLFTLKSSIIKYGWIAPVFVWNKTEILDGHGRLKVLQELFKQGYTIEGDIPVCDIEAKTRKEAAEILLAISSRYQRITEEGLQEFIKLNEITLDDLPIFDLPEINLDVFSTEYQQDTEEDDFNPEEEAENIKVAKTKVGDIYQLGNNRLMCGDSTKKEDVEKLMNGNKADMVFTDPPYNVNYKGTGENTSNGIMGDNQTEEKFIEFSEKWIGCMKTALKEGGTYYICSGYNSYPTFLYGLKLQELYFSQVIIWVKNNTSFGWSDYHHKHEMVIRGKVKKDKKKTATPILYGWNNGRHFFTETRLEADVWEIKRRNSNTMVHPTQKPLEIVVRAIKNSSKIGETIADLFTGSGTTLIACEKTGRICYGMEFDPIYCDIIVKRWKNLTGKQAKLITQENHKGNAIIMQPKRFVQAKLHKERG